MKHTLSVIVENKFGVLARIAGLFSARGFNISSLAVAPTDDPLVSRITMVVDAADEKILEQIKKQLNRLIDVITVVDFTKKDFIDREIVLVKVNADSKAKHRINHLVEKFSAKIAESRPDYVIIEAAADQHKIKELLDSLTEFGIKELVRSGKVAIAK